MARGPGRTPAAPSSSTSRSRQEGQGARRVMPETEPSPLSETAVAPAGPVPGPGRPVSESAARRSRRVAAPALLAPGSREAESARVRGGRKGARGRRSRRAAGGARASRGATHSPPHAAVRESQSSRSACTQRRRFMLLLGRAAAARARGRGGRAPRGWERREPRTVRACVGARSSRGSPAAPRAGRLPRPLAAASAAASLSCGGAARPSGPPRAAPGTAASSFQEAGCSAEAPAARGPHCQRECSPLTPGAAFCSLWLGREPTWSCGHREAWRGGRKRERERASCAAPLPARLLQPQAGREREPRGGPTTKAARPL